MTNAAPQHPSFNKDYWKEMEIITKNNMEACQNAYFITGVAPGNDNRYLRTDNEKVGFFKINL